jgi:transcriptional regulator with XRE-family HTH domain
MKTVWTLEDIADVMRERRQQLGLSQLAVDDLSGLTAGYTSKVEMSVTNPTGKNARRLGNDSLPLMLAALGVCLTLTKTGKNRSGNKDLTMAAQRKKQTFPARYPAKLQRSKIAGARAV